MTDNKVSSDWKPNYNLDKIDNALAELKEHIAKVERLANTHTGVVMPVEDASFLAKIHANIDYYNSRTLGEDGELRSLDWRAHQSERPLKPGS